MSQNTTREVILRMRERYGRRGCEGRSRLLDELCELCGYGRKHAIKLLGGKLPVAGEKGGGAGRAGVTGRRSGRCSRRSGWRPNSRAASG